MSPSNTKVRVAALQSSYTQDKAKNIARVTEQLKEAAAKKAQIALPSELFESHYFCKEEKDELFALAAPLKDNKTIAHFSDLARELRMVIPVSFFEQDGPRYFNSIAIIDADGKYLGLYRKSHIPDGPGYEEKFYFRPGDTGFKAWDTKYGRIGVGICWDQWYPECARAMMLQGAELLFYPTAIGSEPENPSLDTKDLWQRAMIGHCVSNVVPVIASNRTGTEGAQSFYGHSFIADHRGEKVAELGRNDEGVITADFDIQLIRKNRASFGFFRDRRPELYRAVDGF
jgi:N-carbamoylputrescine amidase